MNAPESTLQSLVDERAFAEIVGNEAKAALIDQLIADLAAGVPLLTPAPVPIPEEN